MKSIAKATTTVEVITEYKYPSKFWPICVSYITFTLSRHHQSPNALEARGISYNSFNYCQLNTPVGRCT